MPRSIIQDDPTHCYLCGRNGYEDPLELHHVFGGPRRHLADEDGLTVYLCGARCHRLGKFSAHNNRTIRRMLQAEAQTAYEQTHTHAEWMERYGRNYK